MGGEFFFLCGSGRFRGRSHGLLGRCLGLARISAVFLDSPLYLVSVRGASWFTLLIRPIDFVSTSKV